MITTKQTSELEQGSEEQHRQIRHAPHAASARADCPAVSQRPDGPLASSGSCSQLSPDITVPRKGYGDIDHLICVYVNEHISTTPMSCTDDRNHTERWTEARLGVNEILVDVTFAKMIPAWWTEYLCDSDWEMNLEVRLVEQFRNGIQKYARYVVERT